MNDLISRQDAIDAICKKCKADFPDTGACDICDEISVLKSLPSAEKKGKWIEDDDATVRGHCSVCGWESHYYEDDVVGANFCPNCGAKMEA